MDQPTTQDAVKAYWTAQESFFALLAKIRNEELQELRAYHRTIIERRQS